jgi:hypothetical protein
MSDTGSKSFDCALALDEAAPWHWHTDGLDEAAMERAADAGPAALEVFVSEEAVALPLQKCVQDHRQEQLPYISELKAISLVEIIVLISLI